MKRKLSNSNQKYNNSTRATMMSQKRSGRRNKHFSSYQVKSIIFNWNSKRNRPTKTISLSPWTHNGASSMRLCVMSMIKGLISSKKKNSLLPKGYNRKTVNLKNLMLKESWPKPTRRTFEELSNKKETPTRFFSTIRKKSFCCHFFCQKCHFRWTVVLFSGKN